VTARRRILVIEDDASLATVLRVALEGKGYAVDAVADGRRGWEALKRGGASAASAVDAVLLDLALPGMTGMEILGELARAGGERPPVVVMTAHGSVESAVGAMKLGAAHYLVKPFDMDEMAVVLERAIEVGRVRSENRQLRGRLREFFRPGDFVGESASFRAALDVLRQAAGSEATVLLVGESGTGKELAARSVHALSPRADGPFVAVNCAAVPESLMESELFGHVRGAFTGAVSDHEGRFERAGGGTLFLDEIGEMPAPMQAKLLRAVQEREVERVGGTRPVPVDVRIVAASKTDLKEAVARGAFREDLYFRINVIQVRMPPLRERRDDLPLLCRHFLERRGRGDVSVEPAVLELFARHNWPGNVRELEHVLERALVLLGDRRTIGPDLVPEEVRVPGAPPAAFALPEGGIVLEDLERRLIEAALDRTGGNQTRAADLLGLTRATLIYRMEKYGIGGKGPADKL
jgi:two-component system NtrC family response regulator